MVMQAFAEKIVEIYNESIFEYIDMTDCPIFHYTSPSGVNGIISNHTLRFTDRNYLNDFTEGRYVMQLCLQSRCQVLLPKEYRKFFIDKCAEVYSNPGSKKRLVYQCSFSTADDNLALWNYYTKGEGIKGYNLRFSAKELADTLETRNAKNVHRTYVACGKVIYNSKKQKEIIKKIILQFAEAIIQSGADSINAQIAIEFLIEKLLYIGSFFKPLCFSHEEEYRLIIKPFPAYNKDEKRIEFINLGKTASTYEKNGLLIPYVDIEFPKGALKSITASPTLNFEEVEANLKNAMRIYGYPYEKIKITPSKIPVRY